MAAIRKIVGRNRNLTSFNSNSNGNCSLIPPTLFISCRGIASKLFVGGLSFYTSNKGLSDAFSQYGQVVEANIVMDRVSDKSKGFGFVTFASHEEAEKALSEMNGKTLDGRVIVVDYAKPKTSFRSGMPIARGPPESIADRVKVNFFDEEPKTQKS
ncbi:hypothetical protein WN944_004795 [Citrus x changshan-huyou]|uniref:Small RNA-binding protein 11 n=3 Tax=Citrus TaxID=2706 RepID=A0ACB8K0A1_CITSI|nr:small RNA-binding protein 11, chloroplastic isoform X1 [Citrus x clementina]ESR43372.1 hypothetical protein CICLE_v10012994mg [Citrus x clementina]KAH9738075.1 Small RNA-binding protein 11 [Citrus sinensis]